MFDKKTVEIIDQLFVRLININSAYRACWKTDDDLMGAKKEWILAFMENNITDIAFLKLGLIKCRADKSPFPPSPGQFIDWCKPSANDLGLPSPDSAYQEACKNSHTWLQAHERKWSHETIKNAALKVGYFELKDKPRSVIFPVFKRAYEEAIDIFINGGNLNQIENKAKDTPENRMEYQVYCSNAKFEIEVLKRDWIIMNYDEWLMKKAP